MKRWYCLIDDRKIVEIRFVYETGLYPATRGTSGFVLPSGAGVGFCMAEDEIGAYWEVLAWMEKYHAD